MIFLDSRAGSTEETQDLDFYAQTDSEDHSNVVRSVSFMCSKDLCAEFSILVRHASFAYTW